MGSTLGLPRGGALPQIVPERHMYQDLAPINSLVASILDPAAYYATSPPRRRTRSASPGCALSNSNSAGWRAIPRTARTSDLPYPFMQHLREALMELNPVTKQNKLVHRVHSLEFPFRMVKHGFYVGIGPELVFYPMLAQQVLRRDHPNWWRSANL